MKNVSPVINKIIAYAISVSIETRPTPEKPKK